MGEIHHEIYLDRKNGERHIRVCNDADLRSDQCVVHTSIVSSKPYVNKHILS